MNIKINGNFSLLGESYLFSKISERIKESFNDGVKRTISLGIGDVSLPLPLCVADAMADACSKMSTREGFRGYGNTRGELALRDAISRKYAKRGVNLSVNEIFVSDGAKSDLGNINDLLGDNLTVICDPIYPVYLDASVISGRRVKLLKAKKENGFLPTPDELQREPCVIYLCSPSNPTGAVFNKAGLKKWIDFALDSGSVIVFDAAYEAYISDETLPRSIFEIDGARDCAIEVCSFSKSAGFTGIRCGWTAIPSNSPMNKLWERRQSTKFNGASYISQVGALASLSPSGERKNAANVAYYMENARILADFLDGAGVDFCGGKNAPYLWLECPRKMRSWDCFDYLLINAQIVGTPGAGFGKEGEGFFRFSAFASREDVLEAVDRMKKLNF